MDEGSARDSRRQRLGRLGAIVVALLFLLVVVQGVIREGLPWSWEEISLGGLILIGAAVALGLYVEDHRSQEGGKPLLGQHARVITVILVLAAACGVAGFAVGTERAATDDQVARADIAPTEHLARIMEKLRRAGATAFVAGIAQSNPVIYASGAYKLSRAFEKAASDAEQLRFHRLRIDLAPLIADLKKLSAAYHRLGNAALRFDAEPALFEPARQRIRWLDRSLRRAEKELGDSGLPIVSPP